MTLGTKVPFPRGDLTRIGMPPAVIEYLRFLGNISGLSDGFSQSSNSDQQIIMAAGSIVSDTEPLGAVGSPAPNCDLLEAVGT